MLHWITSAFRAVCLPKGQIKKTALAEVVTEIEKKDNRVLALAILLDIDGAFNYTIV